MATCPKCQLPNPEAGDACIWCGQHQLEAGEALVSVGAAVTSSDSRPLSSHTNLILTPTIRSGSVENRTVAATPNALAVQHAVPTPVPSDTTPPGLQAKLVVIRGQRINQEFPLYPGRNLIGRFADRPVDIDLIAQEAEGQVWSSRQHALITFDKNVLLIEDLNSLNGTWVNGTKLLAGNKRTLQPHDIIQIGTVQIKLVIL